MGGFTDREAKGRLGSLCLALAAMVVLAIAVTLFSASRPWYVYGSDAFTARKNGWDTCPHLLLTRSFEVWFLLLTGLQAAGVVIVCRFGRVRLVGVVLIVLAGALGTVQAFRQLDAYEVGIGCNGYEFTRLRPVMVATVAMLIAHSALTVIALIVGFRKRSFATSRSQPEQSTESSKPMTPSS